MIVGACVHPQRAADRTWNTAEAFNPRQPVTSRVNAKTRQRIAGAHRYTVAFKLRLSFQIFQAQNDVMMRPIVGQHIAARSQRPPDDTSQAQLVTNPPALPFPLPT